MEDVSKRLVGEMAACIAASIEAGEPLAKSVDGPGAATPSASAPAPAPATAKPVNALGLLFSVLWARLRRLFGSRA
jgi:hypothetical protein